MSGDTSTFIARWKKSGASERANYQLFLTQLCDLIGVPVPDPSQDDPEKDLYVFEKAVTFKNGDGTTSSGRIDLYKKGCFVLEAKQGSDKAESKSADLFGDTPKSTRKGTAVRGTKGWDDAMMRARGQAESYAKALPEWPPLLIIVDVGHSIEMYADFSLTGKNYSHFPDLQSFRLKLDDLAKPDVRERLRLAWTDPTALDPARIAARVTREIAERLAKLTRSLENAGHDSQSVAEFLMRCLFTMFAEDVGLLKPANGFTDLLKGLRGKAGKFAPMAESLWATMDKGGFSPILREDVLRFNGGLFNKTRALPLNDDQLALLIEAAKSDWKDVEPAIFGTLLEQALDPRQRHDQGMHYTPRAYVERLVMPTIIEPLRNDWDDVKAAAVDLARRDKVDDAIEEVTKFHKKLCETKVLDPACGSGNFLYVTMELMKRLEGEVIDLLENLNATKYQGQEYTRLSYLLELESHTIDPHQFLGIEINPRAAVIAELVLWIGYLQWHFKTRGRTMPAQPVLRNFKNIECRDAILTWDTKELKRDEHGKPITRWDGVTTKKHPVTGEDVPDETARVEVYDYKNPRKAEWPQADFIVGNPPFLGGKDIRQGLGDGYAQALWDTHPDLPDAIDLVMYWWDKAAGLVREGKARRFGFITTKAIYQTFSRRVTQHHLDASPPLSLIFAIANHPWADASGSADVRIAMTVGSLDKIDGCLETVITEAEALSETPVVTTKVMLGKINADLKIGADIPSAVELAGNSRIATRGVALHGAGFIVTRAEAKALGIDRVPGLKDHIFGYRNGRDLAGISRDAMVIDLEGLSSSEVKERFPEVYQ